MKRKFVYSYIYIVAFRCHFGGNVHLEGVRELKMKSDHFVAADFSLLIFLA